MRATAERRTTMRRQQQRPMIFESKVSADLLERTVQLGNTAERLGAMAEEIEIISTMLKECRLSPQAKTLHSMVEAIQQIIGHLRNRKDLKALLERERIRKTGSALMVAYLTKSEGETFKIKRSQ
jgi:hypothetical protein